MEVAQRSLRPWRPLLTLEEVRWKEEEEAVLHRTALRRECTISTGLLVFLILILRETVKSFYSCFSARSSIVSI